MDNLDWPNAKSELGEAIEYLKSTGATKVCIYKIREARLHIEIHLPILTSCVLMFRWV